MSAVIYTRVSRDSGEGRSVADQERECRAICDSRGWDVRKVFCDNDISASRYAIKSRPEWKRLKSELRPGDVLVCWEASRTTRDLGEFLEIRDLCSGLGVPLSYAGKTLDFTNADDRFSGGLDALLSERESEQLRLRVLRGKEAAASEGRPPGKPPWGYYSPSPGVWAPDPVEAPRVREAAEKILAGESQNAVMRWLAETGYSPSNATVLRRALENPAMAGLRKHQQKIVGRANWEPILTEEQWQAVCARFRLNPSSPGPDAKHLLSGIAKCGKCGKGLRHKTYKHRRDGYVCPSGCVFRVSEQLDRFVVNRLMERLEGIDPDQYEDDGTAARINKEIDLLRGELDEWTDKAIASEVSPASFAKIERGLQDRIEALQASIPPPVHTVDTDTLRANWKDLSIVEQRNAIRLFLGVTVPQLGRSRAAPGDVQIVAL